MLRIFEPLQPHRAPSDEEVLCSSQTRRSRLPQLLWKRVTLIWSRVLLSVVTQWIGFLDLL